MDPISVKFVLIRSFKPSDFRRKLSSMYWPHYQVVCIAYDDELLLNFSLNPNCGSNANLCPCIRAADGCSMSGTYANKPNVCICVTMQLQIHYLLVYQL